MTYEVIPNITCLLVQSPTRIHRLIKINHRWIQKFCVILTRFLCASIFQKSLFFTGRHVWNHGRSGSDEWYPWLAWSWCLRWRPHHPVTLGEAEMWRCDLRRPATVMPGTRIPASVHQPKPSMRFSQQKFSLSTVDSSCANCQQKVGTCELGTGLPASGLQGNQSCRLKHTCSRCGQHGLQQLQGKHASCRHRQREQLHEPMAWHLGYDGPIGSWATANNATKCSSALWLFSSSSCSYQADKLTELAEQGQVHWIPPIIPKIDQCFARLSHIHDIKQFSHTFAYTLRTHVPMIVLVL